MQFITKKYGLSLQKLRCFYMLICDSEMTFQKRPVNLTFAKKNQDLFIADITEHNGYDRNFMIEYYGKNMACNVPLLPFPRLEMGCNLLSIFNAVAAAQSVNMMKAMPMRESA